MPRLPLITTPADHPGTPDAAPRADLDALFAALFPGNPAPAFDSAHEGMAIAAHSPALAQALARTSAVVLGELGWCQQHPALREIVIQRVFHHFGSAYGWQSRLPHAARAGLTPEQLADIPLWRASAHFDADQRLTLEHTEATLAGAVDDALFARMQARFGNRETVECTSLVAFWSSWAMLLSALRPGE